MEAQKCYSEAIGLIDKDYPEYAKVNKRSEVLDELVTYVVSVELQDSLQHLATLSEAERLQIVEKIIEDVKKKEEEERKEAERQELMNKREEAMGEQPFGNKNQPNTPTISTGDKSWYFYNQQLVRKERTTSSVNGDAESWKTTGDAVTRRHSQRRICSYRLRGG